MSIIDDFHEESEQTQLSIGEVINRIKHLIIENSNLKESLEIFMVLDQLHVKINELNTEMEQLIQDLVMANGGHVTPTLLSIAQLLNVTQQAKYEWNFQSFFDSTNIALYYPLLNSFINGTGVIIDIPFSSELKHYMYTLIPSQ